MLIAIQKKKMMFISYCFWILSNSGY